MHFYESLNEPIQDYEYERQQLEELFSKSQWRNFISLPNMPVFETLEMYLENAFRRSLLRGSASNFKSFFATHSRHWAEPSLTGLLYYSEMMLNIVSEFHEQISRNLSATGVSEQIKANIRRILEKTNHHVARTKDNYIFIVRDDVMVATAINDMTDAEAKCAVLEYTHFDLKGKLSKKRELLRTIGQYIEPVLQEMKGSQAWLTQEIGFCLNTLHIRHNNKTGKKANSVIQAMSDAELETCYDSTYRELLLLIELKQNLSFHKKVMELRKQLDGTDKSA